MNWYYATNGAQKGPIPTEDLKSRIAMGEVAPTDLAWREGMSDWMPVSNIPELKVEEAPPRTEVPASVAGPSSAPEPQPYQAPAAAPASRYAPVTSAPPSQGLAIASMVCGILALVSCCLVGPLNAPLVIAAVVCGHIALSKIKADPQRTGGKGMARAGLITGYLGLLSIIFFVVVIAIAGSTDPRVIQEKIIQMAPPEVQQQMREQMEQQQKLRER